MYRSRMPGFLPGHSLARARDSPGKSASNRDPGRSPWSRPRGASLSGVPGSTARLPQSLSTYRPAVRPDIPGQKAHTRLQPSALPEFLSPVPRPDQGTSLLLSPDPLPASSNNSPADWTVDSIPDS